MKDQEYFIPGKKINDIISSGKLDFYCVDHDLRTVKGDAAAFRVVSSADGTYFSFVEDVGESSVKVMYVKGTRYQATTTMLEWEVELVE